jgi:hypothetical protein
MPVIHAANTRSLALELGHLHPPTGALSDERAFSRDEKRSGASEQW